MKTIQIIGFIQGYTGKTVAEVAAEYGYAKSTFYRAIKRDIDSPEVREIISSLIKKPENEIWPEAAGEKRA